VRLEAHDPNGERKRLPRATVMRTRGVKWPPRGGPRGNICRMGMDQGESWATKTRIRGIQGRQYGGPGGFKCDNGVDHEDQVHASMELRIKVHATTNWKSKGPRKHRPGGWTSLQARTREVKAHAGTNLNIQGRLKRGPSGQRSTQA